MWCSVERSVHFTLTVTAPRKRKRSVLCSRSERETEFVSKPGDVVCINNSLHLA